MTAAGRGAAVPGLVLLVALLLAGACATVEAPGGGPVDRIPPELVTARPGSAAVGLHGVRRLELVFSEKVQPRPPRTLLRTYPPLEIRGAHWHHRQAVTVVFADTLPGDTVIVVEVPPGLTDVHRVRSERLWQFPLATAGSLPPGEIRGRLLLHGEPVAGGIVELLGSALDTSRGIPEHPVWRRAAADSSGRFILPWLPVPCGPALLRAFADRDGDGRPGEREPQRTWEDTLRLTGGAPVRDVGTRILYEPTDPGTLLVACPTAVPPGGPVLGWPAAIAETDTGFVPVATRRPPRGRQALVRGDTIRFPAVGPGLVRLVAFVDRNGDSLLSAVSASTLITTAAGTTGAAWWWEPYVVVDSLLVPPGRPVPAALPPAPWITAPAPAPADTAAADSVAGAVADTSRVAVPPDSSSAVPSGAGAGTTRHPGGGP